MPPHQQHCHTDVEQAGGEYVAHLIAAEFISMWPLQVPFESLRRTTRDRKYVIDEVQAVMASFKDGGTSSSAGTAQSREEQTQAVDGAVKRLQSLKRKACMHLLMHACKYACTQA